MHHYRRESRKRCRFRTTSRFFTLGSVRGRYGYRWPSIEATAVTGLTGGYPVGPGSLTLAPRTWSLWRSRDGQPVKFLWFDVRNGSQRRLKLFPTPTPGTLLQVLDGPKRR